MGTVADIKRQLHLGMVLGEAAHQLWHERLGRGRHGGDPQPP
jgi:hypothetical protein